MVVWMWVRRDGFYSVNVGTDRKIIAINSNMCLTYNFYLFLQWQVQCYRQRIYIIDRRDSTRNRFTKICLTESLPALSAVYCTTCPSDRAGGERLGESNLCKTMAGAVPSITDIYILWAVPSPVVEEGRRWVDQNG